MAADQGPTTVGSIVGKLRMDRAQWVADVAATKQDARELGALDPTIHIDDNAAAVVGRMAAAKTATDALGASSEDLGRKTRKTADETIRANEANKTSVTRVGAIVTAIALLVPLLSPVGAAAIGIGGAFLGMGAAGVFALIGIKREMEDGTAVGGAYRAGIDSLKSSMSTLAQTSAVAMLSSFQRVVKETKDALPGLNVQVGQFSGLLGRSGGNLFTGTINALRVLNPLFLTAGVYLESLTEGFQRWTQGSGIEEFGGYALAALPQVVDVLGKLASMVMHILQALIPLGTIGLAALSGIADVINAIPVDVLSQLIVTITWGAIAFKAWGFIAPMLATIATSMGAVGVATTIATGPIGWVVAGLAALAGILAVIIVSNQDAATATEEYTSAVEADSGAIGENVRVRAVDELAKRGALDLAKKLGISTNELTDATTTDTDARKRLIAQLEAEVEAGTRVTKMKIGQRTVQDEQSRSAEELIGILKEESGAIEASSALVAQKTEALVGSTAATYAQTMADEAVAAALGISVGALQAARAGQTDVKEATAKATAEMYIQGDAAGLLKQQLDLLNGKALDNAQAQNRFDSSLANMGAHIDKTGKDVDRATASLEGMSAAAVANRGELISSTQAAEQSAQAFRDMRDENGNLINSGEAARQKLIEMKQAIIDHAVSVGEDRDQVTKFVDSIYQIPATVTPTKFEVDTTAAEAKIAALKESLAAFQNSSYGANISGYIKSLDRQAMGGTAKGMAGGGSVMGPGTAGSDSAGIYRLAHGEEVISDVFGQATRNRTLLKQINAGYTPNPSSAGYASSTGGSAPAQVIQKAAPIININVTGTQNEDPQLLANIIGRKVKDVLAGVPR